MIRISSLAFLAALALPASAGGAQTALVPVVVTATRDDHSSFDLPMAIDTVEGSTIQARAGISEILNRIPGVSVQNRETFSQEQQITLRGFGARSQFGVRGVRLLADGIPASAPDGQAGSGLFDLSSARRIEVLRGPFSSLYGNHSGGVVQIFTEDGPARPILSADLAGGSHGSWRRGLKFGGQWDGLKALVSVSRFDTNGYRRWSAARKEQTNAKLRHDHGDTRMTLVLNTLDQPDNLDPLGLSAAQMAEDRRQANPAARAFRTRRNLRNAQIGGIIEHALGGARALRAVIYGGERSNEQYLAFPGTGTTSSGGVSAFDRGFWGTGLRWSMRAGSLALTAGADYEQADDHRRGYVNDAGVKGALKRDEDNRVWQAGVYAQAEWSPSEMWSVHGGVRHSRLRFVSRDHYVTGANPDDSGSIGYSAWTPTAGVLYRVNERMNVYASAGRSFEAPTFIELAYRPDGAGGLNLALRPSISRHLEAGVKALLGADTLLTAAAFRIDTRSEIVVDTNTGGRTTYRNAGDTLRSGFELGLDARLGQGFTAIVSFTWLEARFREGFAGAAGEVKAGNRIPGLPRRTLFAEIGWHHARSGFSATLEGRASSAMHVDDRNAERASGSFVANLRAGLEQRVGAWEFSEFLRIDNLADREYVSAVYVNDGNGRYFAPAAGRSQLLGVRAAYRF